MAVEHVPEHTLTRHRFSRAGDRWKFVLPRLRNKPIASLAFDVLNIDRVWEDGSYRIPIPCRACKVLKLSDSDTYAIEYRGGGVHDLFGPNSRPQNVGCLACGETLDVIDLLADMTTRWKAKDLDLLVTKGPFAAYAPHYETWVVDQPQPGKFWIGRTVYDALYDRVGRVFPLTRRLSRIEALDAEHALELVELHHASMTWRDVQITRELEPEDPAWHGGPLAVWEQHKVQRRAQAERSRKRAALEAELESIRRAREAELGI